MVILLEGVYLTFVSFFAMYQKAFCFCSSTASNFKLREDVKGQQRIFFDPFDRQSNIVTGVFNISKTMVQSCQNFTFYIRVKIVLDLLWLNFMFLSS